jgi:predicted nucleic acid-binding protein
VTVKSADMERAVQFVRAYTLAHGTGWPDCLLAATCLRLEVPVVTLNDKHFSPIRGLAVIRPY